MNNANKMIQFHASNNYGHLIIASEPNYDNQKEMYISKLYANYPLIIKNEKPPKTKAIHVFEINNLGFITSDKNGKILKEYTTTREDCIKNIQSFLEMWKKQAEAVIVYVTIDKIVKGLRFNHFLDPISEIISELWEYEKINVIEIDYCRSKERRQKTRLYLNMLVGLEVVRKQGGDFVEGNLAVAMRKEANGDKQCFREMLFSTIFRERYFTLRDVFKLRMFEPMVRVASCIYFPEIETENQIYRSIETISNEFKRNYRKPINNEALKRNLEQLVEFKIIEQEDNHFYGKEDLRKIMISRKKELGQITNIPMAIV